MSEGPNEAQLTAWAVDQIECQPEFHSSTLCELMDQDQVRCSCTVNYAMLLTVLKYPRRWLLSVRLDRVRKRKHSPVSYLAFKNRYQLEGTYGFIVGYVVNQSYWCDHCNKGNGPFPYCVILPNLPISACMCCHYHSKANSCSIRSRKSRTPLSS